MKDLKTSAEPCRVIVVDDDAVTRELLHGHIAPGHEVTLAASGREALAHLERTPVDVVIADWIMPEMSGLQLLRWVRSRPFDRQPHFVMLTANTAAERLVEAFDAGVDDFLCKPVDSVELLARMQAWTRLVTLQNEALRLAGQLRQANEELKRIASTDDLTGLNNRRTALERLDHAIRLADRHGHPLACALIDVDHFKQFNDRHGHATGDEVLKHFAAVLKRSTRATDTCCRLGGDEFLVILPHTGIEAAGAWTEHFAETLRNTPLALDQLRLGVTASIGLVPWKRPLAPHKFIEQADQMLYEAKHAGRATTRSHAA